MNVRVKSYYSIETPLGMVPSGDWPEVVSQKIMWARDKLGVDFGVAVGIIDDFDKNDVWGFLGKPREYVVERQFQIPPESLNRLTKVYHELKAEGRDQVSFAEVVNSTPTLTKPGEIGRGRIRVAISHSNKQSSTSQYRLIARLKRDAPEIAEQLANGKYPSVRAAAIAAGIVKVKSPLDQLRTWWKKASELERETFRQEI